MLILLWTPGDRLLAVEDVEDGIEFIVCDTECYKGYEDM